MQTCKLWAVGIVASTLSLAAVMALIVPNADAEPTIVPQEIRDAVNKMADTVHKGKRIDKDADAFFKNHKDSLKQTMWLFKTREKDGKGGFGIGPDPAKYKVDSIEVFLFDQADKTPTMPLDVKKSADDLTRMADVTLAVADILYRYRPDKEKVGERNWAVWTDATDRMKKASLDLKVGVKQQDEAAIKRALFVLNLSCTHCHNSFCTHCHNSFRDKPLIAQKKNPAKIILPNKIQDAVIKMADDIAQGKNVDKEATAFFKAHPGELKTTMWIFKPRTYRKPMASAFIVCGSIAEASKSHLSVHEGGVGIGPVPGVYKKDGIEVLIINKGDPKPRNADQMVTKEELAKNGEDYLRVADVIIAMGEITHQYKPTKKLPDKDPADWTKYADDMKSAAIVLKVSVNAKNPAATKMAFIKLSSSCASCHRTFRLD